MLRKAKRDASRGDTAGRTRGSRGGFATAGGKKGRRSARGRRDPVRRRRREKERESARKERARSAKKPNEIKHRGVGGGRPAGRPRFIGRLMKNSDALPAFYLPLCVGLLSLCVSPLRVPSRCCCCCHYQLPPVVVAATAADLWLSLSPPSPRRLFPFLSLSLALLLYEFESRHRLPSSRDRLRALRWNFTSGFHAATSHITTCCHAAGTTTARA